MRYGGWNEKMCVFDDLQDKIKLKNFKQGLIDSVFSEIHYVKQGDRICVRSCHRTGCSL